MRPVCATALLACSVLARPAATSPDSCDPGTRELVTTIGDSIMAGTSASVGDALVTELGTTDFAVQGCAAGGSRVADCIAKFNSYANTNVGTVAWNCGTNNLVNGQSAASTWAEAEVALDAIRAQGVKIALVNVTPCGGYSGCQPSEVTSYNALLAAWCATEGAAACQFFDAYTATATGTALSVGCNEGDNLHLSAGCTNTIYAPGIATAVEAL